MDKNKYEKLKEEYREMEFVGLFKELIKLFNIETYVELGVRRGYTFNQIAPLVKRAVAVDIVIRHTIINLPHVEKYRMKTDDFAKVWKDPIDLLFIDACHKSEQVIKDFSNFYPFVKPETGFIAIHDTYPISEDLLSDDKCSDSWKIPGFIESSSCYGCCQLFTFPGPFAGLTLVRKGCSMPEWMRKKSDICNNSCN